MVVVVEIKKATMDSANCKHLSESEDSLPMIDVDVVIIGAGISGLSAAYHIQQKDTGIQLAVLEAKGLQLFTSSSLLLMFVVSTIC